MHQFADSKIAVKKKKNDYNEIAFHIYGAAFIDYAWTQFIPQDARQPC